MKIKSLLLSNLTFIFCLSFLQNVSAQTSFSVSGTYLTIEKNTGYFVVYDFTELTNLTGQDLQMRWIKTVERGFPAGWDSGVQDPDSTFLSANTIDSSDFILSDTGAYNMLIYQVYPNEIAGSAVVSFLIFPVTNPSDSVRVTFDITIHQEQTSGIQLKEVRSQVNVFPIHAATGS